MNHQILSVCALAFLWGTASAQPRCEVRHPDPAALAAAAERARSVSAMLTGSADASLALVDVLVAYDKSGADYAMRKGGVEAFAEARIAEMNDCLPNTGLDAHLRFRLAGTVAIEETAWGLASALCQLIDDYGTVVAKGEWRKITDARERLGADVVSVLIDNGSPDSGTIGLGYSLDDLNEARGFADWAYSVCNIRAVEDDFTMLHEIGHNMGCGHPDASCASARAMSLGPQSAAYAAGFYTWSGGNGYYTIMGYNFGGLRPDGTFHSSDRFEPLPCFSSPDFTYNGLQIGTAFNDNTSVLIATCAAVSRFRTAKVPEEDIVIDCFSIAASTLMVGVAGPAEGYAVTCSAEIKKMTAKGLPQGMKLVQDKTTKEWSIQGAPKKAQRGSFTLTVTTVSKKTASRSFDYEVLPLPSELSGTFNGFIFAGEAKVGSVSVTVKDGGKITAKVVTAAKTISFSTTGWGMVDEACVGTVGIVTKKGEELELQIDGAAAWNEGCVEGAFQTSDGEVFSVQAWRNAYAENGKMPADPDAAAFLAEILSSNKGKYLFDAEERDDGSWLFVRSESKKPAVTVTVDKKGMVKVKGKVDGISLNGTAQLLVSEDGAALAEFAIPVKIGKEKSIADLSIELMSGAMKFDVDGPAASAIGQYVD